MVKKSRIKKKINKNNLHKQIKVFNFVHKQKEKILLNIKNLTKWKKLKLSKKLMIVSTV